jgi:hypothetical protein
MQYKIYQNSGAAWRWALFAGHEAIKKPIAVAPMHIRRRRFAGACLIWSKLACRLRSSSSGRNTGYISIQIVHN